MKLISGHLTYCTNIHAGESWPEHFLALKQNFPIIKNTVSPDAPMGIGLRLSNLASEVLANEENILLFKQWLQENEAYVFTMNGFPYGEFHHAIVKDQVHTPDWTTVERVDYTIRLFNIMANLLPAGMDGGVSTSPLSYRHWYSTDELLIKAKNRATHHILLVAEALIAIRRSKGVIMHLDIEPEPDGILETGDEFIDWFEQELLPKGQQQIADKFNISAAEAETLLKDHICLCYDVCHFAIGYETHKTVIKKLNDKGIKVGKIQISAALKASIANPDVEKGFIFDEFSKFNEPTYLHQVVARKPDGTLLRYPDLPEALLDSERSFADEWRAHFHVPIFAEDLGLLKSTQADIIQVLKIHKDHSFTNHLEVETYTWEVLPEALKLPMNESIARELNWVKDQLK